MLVREQLGRRTVAIHPAASPGAKGSAAPGPSPDRRAKTATRPGGLLWTTSPDGGVRFGPAITSGVACVAANNFALCGLDAANGKTLWRQTIPGGSITWSLAAADGTVYIVGEERLPVRAAGAHRRHRWKVGGVFGGPALANGAIYIASAASSGNAPLYALRATNGARRWSTNAINGGVVYASAAGGFVFVTGSFGSLSALRTNDGTEMWNTSPAAARNRIPWPRGVSCT